MKYIDKLYDGETSKGEKQFLRRPHQKSAQRQCQNGEEVSLMHPDGEQKHRTYNNAHAKKIL